MSFSTYGTFKTAVNDWAWTEVSTTLIASDFLPLVQSKMFYGHGDGSDGSVQIKPLRIRAMEDTATATPSSGSITISSACGTGWLEFTRIQETAANSRPLVYLEPDDFKARTEYQSAGAALWYTIENDSLLLAPYGTGDVRLRWYEKFTALSADGDTDWILTNAPQVYLDGCMMEACAYLQDSREGMFRQKFAAGINGLNRSNMVTKMGGGVLRSVPRVVV